MDDPFKILVVEDDQIDARFIENVLTSAGFETDIAESSESALTSLNQTAYNLVLVDLKMIDMSGIQILALIKRYYPAVEVIIITAHASIETAVKSMRMGAHSYFIKGEPTRKLIADIRSIADRQNVIRPELLSGNDVTISRLKTRGTTFTHLLTQAESLASAGLNTLITGSTGTGRKVLAKHMCQCGSFQERPVYEMDFSTSADETSFQSTKAKYALRNFLDTHEAKGICLLFNIDQAEPDMLQELLAELEAHVAQHQMGKSSISVISTCTVRSVPSLKPIYGAEYFFRYWGVTLELPEINERREDLPLVIEDIVKKLGTEHNTPNLRIDKALVQKLSQSFFIDEFAGLEKLIARLSAAASGAEITSDLMDQIETSDIVLHKEHPFAPGEPSSLKEARELSERDFITKIYNRCGQNKTRAAAALGISARQLYNMLKKYHQETS